MKTSIVFIQMCLISLLLSSCASRAPSLRMLHKRSNYETDSKEFVYVDDELSRDKAREVKIYIYPNEMPSGDYFQGGYLRAVVEKGKWTYKRKKIKRTKGAKRGKNRKQTL